MFLWLLQYGAKHNVAAEQKLVNDRQVAVQSPDESSSSPQKGSPSKAGDRADPGTPGSITGVGISGFTGGDTQPQVLVSELWLSVLQAFTRVSLEANEHLRNHAVVILHRSAPNILHCLAIALAHTNCVSALGSISRTLADTLHYNHSGQ